MAGAGDNLSVEHCLAVALAWEKEAARLEAERLIDVLDDDGEVDDDLADAAD